jgi:predicted neutral ceramidase superfamily lipid hydrolase
MTKPAASAADRAWTMIEDEKRRDRFLRRVSITAWSVTFIIVLFIGVMIGMQVSQMMKAVAVGAAPPTAVFWSAMPLVIILGVLSLLIATLSTVGVFLRLRTASLAEIQLRLAALEEMLAARGDAQA